MKVKLGKPLLCRKVKNSISEGVTPKLKSRGWEGGNFEWKQGDGFRQGNKAKDSQARTSARQYQSKEGEA